MIGPFAIYSLMHGHTEYAVYQNPSAELLKKLIQKSSYKELRTIFHKEQGLFVWLSEACIHTFTNRYLLEQQGIELGQYPTINTGYIQLGMKENQYHIRCDEPYTHDSVTELLKDS